MHYSSNQEPTRIAFIRVKAVAVCVHYSLYNDKMWIWTSPVCRATIVMRHCHC